MAPSNLVPSSAFLALAIREEYLLGKLLVSELDEQLGHFPFLEDEHLDDRAEFGETLVDDLVADLEGDRVVDADQQHT